MRVIQTDEIETFRAQFHSLLDEMLDKLFFVGMEETPPTNEQPPLEGELVIKTIEAIKDTFLEEINAPIIVSDELEPTPDIPAPEDLPEPLKEPATPNLDEYVEQLKAEHVANGGTLESSSDKTEIIEEFKERFDLEAEMLSVVNDATWLRLVKNVILAGLSVEKIMASESFKHLTLTKGERALLDNLVALRYSMKGKDIDLNQALGLHFVTHIEAGIIKEFAEKENLK